MAAYIYGKSAQEGLIPLTSVGTRGANESDKAAVQAWVKRLSSTEIRDLRAQGITSFSVEYDRPKKVKAKSKAKAKAKKSKSKKAKARTKLTKKQKAYVSRKIGILRREGYSAKQAAAIAYSMARKKSRKAKKGSRKAKRN